MTTLSTHVLDIERGIPAGGVSISLYRGEQHLASATTGGDGRIADVAGGALQPGLYRLVFEVAAYFAPHLPEPAFLQRVSIEFAIRAEQAHYHVPLLVSPYACTSYRGS